MLRNRHIAKCFLENSTLLSQIINIWRFDVRSTIASQFGAQVVNCNEQYIWLLILFCYGPKPAILKLQEKEKTTGKII
jgi:hypothetical protein